MAAVWCDASTTTTQESVFNKSMKFPQSLSAYFKRPSKVTKPGSRNQSPRNNGRRRMTTQVPMRTRSVVDPQRAGMTSRQQTSNYAASVRPTSWHPSIINDFEHYQATNQQFIHQPYEYPTNTTFAYGLVTPTTYPTINEPFIDCGNIPLDQLTGQDYGFIQSDHHYPFDNNLTTFTPMSAGSMDATEYGNVSWPSVPLSNTFNVPTAPTTPDFLPMPDMGEAFDASGLDDDADKDELVGMGLYDSPAQVQSANLLFGGSMPIRKKSLKLEESFEPPPPEDGEDEDAESEPTQLEDDSISEEISEPPSSLQDIPQANPALNYLGNHDVQYNEMQPHTFQNYAAAYEGQQMVNNNMMYGWF